MPFAKTSNLNKTEPLGSKTKDLALWSWWLLCRDGSYRAIPKSLEDPFEAPLLTFRDPMLVSFSAFQV